MPFRPVGRADAWPRLVITVMAACLAAAAPALAEPLAMGEALSRGAAADPRAAATEARLAASEAGARQAALRPNAAIGVEVENLLGTGRYSGLGRAEATVAYEQTWERGTKRQARIDQARAATEVVRRREDVRRLDYLRDVQVAYVQALAAEAELVIAEAALVSARQSQAQIDRRVASARDPLFAAARAETLTAQAQIARDRAQAAAITARAALASHWGGDGDFTLAVEPYFQASIPPSAARDETAPDLALLMAERDGALAAVGVERSLSTADPTLRGGVRYLGEDSEAALVVGATIPLQRGERNRAAIDRALAERAAVEIDLSAAHAAHDREVARLLARLAVAATESERIRTEVIPAALRTLDLVRAGFARGGFEYDDVTDAERALAEARARRVAVLRDYHLDQAALDRLTGRHAALSSSAKPSSDMEMRR